MVYLWNTVSMVYLWYIYGISMVYLWKSMEYLWNIYGISMEYLWNIYGISMEYLWNIEYFLVFAAKIPVCWWNPNFRSLPLAPLASDDELPRGRADSHRAGQVHGDDMRRRPLQNLVPNRRSTLW